MTDFIVLYHLMPILTNAGVDNFITLLANFALNIEFVVKSELVDLMNYLAVFSF